MKREVHINIIHPTCDQRIEITELNLNMGNNTLSPKRASLSSIFRTDWSKVSSKTECLYIKGCVATRYKPKPTLVITSCRWLTITTHGSTY
jgi:hypothetical protein